MESEVTPKVGVMKINIDVVMDKDIVSRDEAMPALEMTFVDVKSLP